ncbi:MAG: MerR family transcriptional regulator [Clostridia bacterium]|nr:MerR family transcriptional regulator [Clostridia bacterium]
MPKYTTGELAAKCKVTVRTVQYYDERGILTPNELSDGGRRLYSENDLKKMKLICFLRDLGLSIKDIDRILKEANSEKVITLLLKKQQAILEREVSERRVQLDGISELLSAVKNAGELSVESFAGITEKMKNANKRKKMITAMIAAGVIMDVIEIGTVLLWIFTGIWWPFAVGMAAVVAIGIWMSAYYFKRTAFICPECTEVFKPKFKEAFFAYHTPKTRKLTCPKCGKKSMCVEIYDDND